MTPECIATIVELALYRVGDRWRRHDKADVVLIGMAVREVAEEMTKLLAEANMHTRTNP